MTATLGVALRECVGACPMHVTMRQKATVNVAMKDPQSGQSVEMPMDVSISFRALAIREVGDPGSDVWEFRTVERDPKSGQEVFILAYFLGSDVLSIKVNPKVIT